MESKLMEDKGFNIEDIADTLENISIDEIISQRDKLSTNMWDVFNDLKAIKMESIKPHYCEPVCYLDKDSYLIRNMSGFVPYGESMNTFYTMEKLYNIKSARRSRLERNSKCRQIVANAIITCEDKFLILGRHKKFSTSELSSQLGLPGGHINKYDVNCTLGLYRELCEELKYFDCRLVKSVNPLGIILLNTDDISGMHMCLLYHIEYGSTKLKAADKLQEFVEWHSYASYENNKSSLKLDSWAKLAIDNYLKL